MISMVFRDKPESFGLVNLTVQSANMEGSNITGSKRASNLISNSQTGRHPPRQSHPHHLCHPHSHGPWHCHCLSLSASLSLFWLFNVQSKPSNCFGIQREPIWGSAPLFGKKQRKSELYPKRIEEVRCREKERANEVKSQVKTCGHMGYR